MRESATKSALQIAFKLRVDVYVDTRHKAQTSQSQYMGTSRVPETHISDHIWSYNLALGDPSSALIGLKSYTYMINRN